MRVVRSPRFALGALVTLSVLLRELVAVFRTTPVLFPDEYTYSAIGRSLAEHGTTAIRGVSPHFPALLQPILTAPLWWLPTVVDSYRAIQLLNILFMSSAAIPTYLIARRLELRRSYLLVAVAVSLVIPDMLYGGWVVTEPYAYPLFLWAAWAALSSLDRPSLKRQALFVCVAFLTLLARSQFVFLLPLYSLTVVVIAVGERDKRYLRRQWLVPAVLLLCAVVVTLEGVGHSLGFYSGILKLSTSPGYLGKWVLRDAVVLAYVAGWIGVPGAILALAKGFVRPQQRITRAFASVTALSIACLLLEAAFYSGGVRVQERYFFYAVPLLAIAFLSYAEQGWFLKRTHAFFVLVMVALVMIVPLTHFTAGHDKDDSPFLLGISWASDTSHIAFVPLLPIFFGLIAILLIVTISWRKKAAVVVAIAPMLLLLVLSSVSVSIFDDGNALAQRKIGQNISYVDSAGAKRADLLVVPGARRLISSWMLFWNKQLDQVDVMPGSAVIDTFASVGVRITPSGLLVNEKSGQPIASRLLYDQNLTTLRWRNGRVEYHKGGVTIWSGRKPQLKTLLNGRHGPWLTLNGSFYQWPVDDHHPLNGHLSLVLSLPSSGIGVVSRIVFAEKGWHATATVAPGHHLTVSIPVCTPGKASVSFASEGRLFAGATALEGTYLLSARSTMPRFIADGSGCRQLEKNAKSASTTLPR